MGRGRALRHVLQQADERPRPEELPRARESDEMAVAPSKDEAAVARLVKEVQAATNEFDALVRELEELDDRIAQAVNALTEAENDADRSAARARLRQLRQQQYEIKQRVAAFRTVVDRRGRIKCLCVPRQCIDNPLAEGCF